MKPGGTRGNNRYRRSVTTTYRQKPLQQWHENLSSRRSQRASREVSGAAERSAQHRQQLEPLHFNPGDPARGTGCATSRRRLIVVLLAGVGRGEPHQPSGIAARGSQKTATPAGRGQPASTG